VDQALATGENLRAGETTILVPELTARLWPAIASLAAEEKTAYCDFGPDLENHMVGFTTGVINWVKAGGATLAVRQVGEMIFASPKLQAAEFEVEQPQLVKYYNGEMPTPVRLDAWQKAACHLWLMGIDLLPAGLENRIRRFWQRQNPGGYLAAVLEQDHSSLAKILLKERSPLAQAYYQWTFDPGPRQSEKFIRALVRSLCRQETEEIRMSLLTLHHLSQDLPGLEPLSLRLAGQPLQPGLKPWLQVPGRLLEPNLAGPLLCLLGHCQEAGIEVQGASLEGQRRRHYSSEQGS
jgi:hypothetical protein